MFLIFPCPYFSLSLITLSLIPSVPYSAVRFSTATLTQSSAKAGRDILKNEMQITKKPKNAKFAFKKVGSFIIGICLEILLVLWDWIYLVIFSTGSIPSWPKKLHPFSSFFRNIHGVRIWAVLLIISWIRIIVFAKLTKHIFIDFDGKTRIVPKDEGVFRISSVRLVTLVLTYEIPMGFIQRFLVEKFVIFWPQVVQLFLHCVVYIFVTCHFLSLKKFDWSNSWTSKKSYYILAFLPIATSFLLLYRIVW